MAMSSERASEAPAQVGSTRSRILDISEWLVQTRGYNAFSYADVATLLGITKPSLHYHFATKADLGEAIIARYEQRFREALASIDAQHRHAPAKLAAYVGLYAGVLREGRMCLCGMLTAEYETMPAAVQDAVLDFFDRNEAWLVHVLEQGLAEGSLGFTGLPAMTARSIISGLEGAMLVARPYGDADRFQAVATRLLAGLTGTDTAS